eukprot:scaffold3445_cov57-Attheya_sp.AAC.2
MCSGIVPDRSRLQHNNICYCHSSSVLVDQLVLWAPWSCPCPCPCRYDIPAQITEIYTMVDVFLIGVCVILAFCFYGICCSRRRTEAARNAELEAFRARNPEDLEAAVEARVTLIEKSLITIVVDDADSVGSMQNMISVAKGIAEETEDKRGNFLSRSWRSASSSVRSLKSKPTCAICLENYGIGDSVSLAKTDQCDHVYHSQCIGEWLANHDDCPLCRTVILNNANTSEHNDEETPATPAVTSAS